MLEKLLETLYNRHKWENPPKKNDAGIFLMELSPDEIFFLQEFPSSHIEIKANLSPLPKDYKEDLFTYLMKANFIGQGTGSCRMGIDDQEKYLTLSTSLPYEVIYEEFKETLEDFGNFLIFWRREIEEFMKKKRITIY